MQNGCRPELPKPLPLMPIASETGVPVLFACPCLYRIRRAVCSRLLISSARQANVIGKPVPSLESSASKITVNTFIRQRRLHAAGMSIQERANHFSRYRISEDAAYSPAFPASGVEKTFNRSRDRRPRPPDADASPPTAFPPNVLHPACAGEHRSER
jgi:hypothetical protein